MDYFATKADFDRALDERLAPLQKELESMRVHRDKVIQEKKAIEGKGVGRTADGVIRTADALHVPRELARDPQAYQRYRKIALDDGLSMKIIDREELRDDKKMPDTFTNRLTHFVNREYIGQDARAYQDEKRFAEKNGLRLHVFGHASELPIEAFLEEATDGK